MVAKNKLVRYLSGLGLGWLMGLGGCLSSSPEDPVVTQANHEQIVVERSKASAPDWAALSPGTLADSGGELRLMTRRSRLFNLTLGLEQAQIAALDAMRLALVEKIQAQVQILVSGSGIESNKAAKWQRLVSESVSTVGDSRLKVRDIYFEGVDDRLAKGGSALVHYYTGYVLTAYPKADLTAIYQDLATRLVATEDTDFSRLAVAVTGLSEKLP